MMKVDTAGDIDTSAAITSWATALPTTGNNVTVKGSSSGVAAVVAVVGSLVASFAF
jgi:hypothetical protein